MRIIRFYKIYQNDFIYALFHRFMTNSANLMTSFPFTYIAMCKTVIRKWERDIGKEATQLLRSYNSLCRPSCSPPSLYSTLLPKSGNFIGWSANYVFHVGHSKLLFSIYFEKKLYRTAPIDSSRKIIASEKKWCPDPFWMSLVSKEKYEFVSVFCYSSLLANLKSIRWFSRYICSELFLE